MSLTVLVIAGAWSPAPARADGDPASDVLAAQALFLPQDAGVSPRQQARLGRCSGPRSAAGIRYASLSSPAARTWAR